VGLHPGARQQRYPVGDGTDVVGVEQIRVVRRPQLDGAGGVAAEVAGVNLGPHDQALGDQAHHRPVVPCPAPPASLPPLPHRPSVTGGVEVVAVAVVHVAGDDDDPTEIGGGEVGGDVVEQAGVW